jgi:hypothetical protein
MTFEIKIYHKMYKILTEKVQNLTIFPPDESIEKRTMWSLRGHTFSFAKERNVFYLSFQDKQNLLIFLSPLIFLRGATNLFVLHTISMKLTLCFAQTLH